MTKEERIARLQRGIDSPETPEHVRIQFQETLESLQRPEPPPPPKPVPVKPRPKPKPKPVAVVVPPQPPQRVFSPEEKEKRAADIRALHAKRKPHDQDAD